MSTVVQSGYGSRRRERYAIRERLRGFSSLKRVGMCGVGRIDVEQGVKVHLSEDRVAHFSNVQTCGSVHSCAVCAPKIRQARAEEISQAAEAHLAAGGGLEFLTLTLPHDVGDRLEHLIASIAKAWHSVASGRAPFGGTAPVGYIRALEVTHGPNGWHPHLHVLLFFCAPISSGQRSALIHGVFERWCAAVGRAGYRAPTLENGINLRKITHAGGIGAYTSKVVGLELARSDLKRARRAASGYRAAFAILAEAVASGDVDDLSLWWEYESATKGKRALVWSRGLKSRFGIGVASDEELAAAEAPAEVVAIIGQATWARIVSLRLRARVLVVAEEHGADGLAEWLARLEEDAYVT